MSFLIDTRLTLEGQKVIDIVPYDAIRHRRGVREILANNGWEERYIAGRLAGLDALSSDPLPGTRTKVCVCEVRERLSGVRLRRVPRMEPPRASARARGGSGPQTAGYRLGARSHRAEEFVQAEGGRGIYVDTPVTNGVGRGFYEALGYRQAYVMPEYSEEVLDGLTYLKLFPK